VEPYRSISLGIRFLVHKHPHVITATEIQIKDSTGVFDPVLRFGSLAEVISPLRVLRHMLLMPCRTVSIRPAWRRS
jgi:hypothetical protein